MTLCRSVDVVNCEPPAWPTFSLSPGGKEGRKDNCSKWWDFDWTADQSSVSRWRNCSKRWNRHRCHFFPWLTPRGVDLWYIPEMAQDLTLVLLTFKSSALHCNPISAFMFSQVSQKCAAHSWGLPRLHSASVSAPQQEGGKGNSSSAYAPFTLSG